MDTKYVCIHEYTCHVGTAGPLPPGGERIIRQGMVTMFVGVTWGLFVGFLLACRREGAACVSREGLCVPRVET